MKSSRVYALCAVLVLAMSAPSCGLFHRSAKTVPPPPSPASAQPSPTPASEGSTQKPEQVAIPAPPQISPQKPDLSQISPATSAQLPPPPHRRKRSARAQNTEPAVAAAPPAQQSPPAEQPAGAGSQAPVSQLEQLLSPEQVQSYNDTIDRNIRNAQQKIGALNGRQLTAEQKTYLDRIRSFIDQSTAARKTDLFRARSLAERASVLAEDLLRSIQ